MQFLANRRDLEVYGVKQGFQGVLGRRFVKLRETDVGHNFGRGGSLLGSVDYRLPSEPGPVLSGLAEALKQFDLVVGLGGLGSYSVLERVYAHHDMGLTTTMFVPATIESEFLDPAVTQKSAEEESHGVHTVSIGADTAANTAIEAIDRLREQAYHSRTVFLVQTVGAKSNYLPIQVGVASGAHRIYLPPYPILDEDDRKEIQELFGPDLDPNRVDIRELVSWIGHMFETTDKKYLVVIIPNGVPLVGRAPGAAGRIELDPAKYEDVVTSMAPLELTALRVVDELALFFSGNDSAQIRQVLLDDLQRGGAPSTRDRVLGSMYGEAAVEEFLSLLNEQGTDKRGHLNLIGIDDTTRFGWRCYSGGDVLGLYKGKEPRAGGSHRFLTCVRVVVRSPGTAHSRLCESFRGLSGSPLSVCATLRPIHPEQQGLPAELDSPLKKSIRRPSGRFACPLEALYINGLLRFEPLQDVSADIRQSTEASCVEVTQAFVVEAHQVEDRRMDVSDRDDLFGASQTELVGGADRRPALDVAAGHPHAQRPAVVITSGAVRGLAVDERRTPHLRRPNDERILEETTLSEIGEQARDGLVDFTRMPFHARAHVAVVVPTVSADLNTVDDERVTHASLDETTREETLTPETGRRPLVKSVHLSHVLGLARDIHQLRRLGLHAERELVGADARVELRRTGSTLAMLIVEIAESVELLALSFFRQALGSLEIEHGRALRTQQGSLIGRRQIAVAPNRRSVHR